MYVERLDAQNNFQHLLRDTFLGNNALVAYPASSYKNNKRTDCGLAILENQTVTSKESIATIPVRK